MRARSLKFVLLSYRKIIIITYLSHLAFLKLNASISKTFQFLIPTFFVTGVLGEIQDEFKIGDDYAGLLQTVFVVAYMVFAPTFGYFGDRYSRRYIMAFGVTLWSLTTLCGSFLHVSIKTR